MPGRSLIPHHNHGFSNMEKMQEAASGLSFIYSRQINGQGPLEDVFQRVNLSSSVSVPYEEFDHPPVQLRYMVDDYWELMREEFKRSG